MPTWNAAKNRAVINATTWPGVANVEWYQRIHDFLCDEGQVSACLVSLAKQTRTAASTGFKNSLSSEIEQPCGFSAEVAALGDVVSSSEFMMRIGSKRPLLDLGVAETHGALTHRIQWALCAVQFAYPMYPLKLGDLYAGLSNPNAWYGMPSLGTLWDILVDSPYNLGDSTKWVYNARSPEFLMEYMYKHSDKRVKDMYQFSRDLAKGYKPVVLGALSSPVLT